MYIMNICIGGSYRLGPAALHEALEKAVPNS